MNNKMGKLLTQENYYKNLDIAKQIGKPFGQSSTKSLSMLDQLYGKQWRRRQGRRRFHRPHLSRAYRARPNTRFGPYPCLRVFPNTCGPHLGHQLQHRVGLVLQWHTWGGSLWPNGWQLGPLGLVGPFFGHIQVYSMITLWWWRPLESWIWHCHQHHSSLLLDPPAKFYNIEKGWDIFLFYFLRLHKLNWLIIVL